MILLNDFKRQWNATRESATEAFHRVGESGWYILGNEVRAFEAAIAREWIRRYAVGVASGLDAIEIALRALGCHAGDRVLTTPLSAFATSLAVVRLGAIPIFIDTDESGLLDLNACREILSRRNDIHFVLPVHLYGFSMNLEQLSAIQRDFDCRVVEDCAQSILASFRGRMAGTVGDLAATSFYPTKNLGAVGDGGAILGDDPSYIQTAAALRDYGQTAKYRHELIGYNSRLDELHAAVLHSAHLPRLREWTERRRQIARLYIEGLDTVNVCPIQPPEGAEPVWHLFPVLVPPGTKKSFLEYLKANDILAGEHYPLTIPDQLAMRTVNYEQVGDCRIARRIAACEVSLPVHPYLSDSEVEHVIAVCRNWKPHVVSDHSRL